MMFFNIYPGEISKEFFEILAMPDMSYSMIEFLLGDGQ